MTRPSLRDANRRVRPHPAALRLRLSPGAHPAGLYLDEAEGVLAVAELGTRRVVLLDPVSGEELGRLPLVMATDPALRDLTIGGALLAGRDGQAYVWGGVGSGQLRRLELRPPPGRLEGLSFSGAGLLRDWLFDPSSHVLAVAARGDPHVYLADAQLRWVRRLPLEASPARLVALPGGRAAALLETPEEHVCVVDLVSGRAGPPLAPWARLPAFPRPPPGEPFQARAPIAAAADGARLYVGCHRTDAAGRRSPFAVFDLVHEILHDVFWHDLLETPTQVAVHPAGHELYVSGDGRTLVLGAANLEVLGELGPGRLTALVVASSGTVAVGTTIDHAAALLFHASGQTLTAQLTPDPEPGELLSVPVVISETRATAYVADRFGDAVLALPFPV